MGVGASMVEAAGGAGNDSPAAVRAWALAHLFAGDLGSLADWQIRDRVRIAGAVANWVLSGGDFALPEGHLPPPPTQDAA